MANIESLHQSAAAKYEEKKLDEALKIYQEIIKLNPIDEVALSCVMDIYLELDDKFNYYLSRANVNIAQNKMEYAIKDTKKALEIDFENVEAKRKLARLYKVDGKNLKAIDEFLRLLEFAPNEIDAYFELVDLYMKEDSLEGAINIAQKALEQFNDNANVKNMLAQLYFKANDFKSALDVVEDKFLKIKILLQNEQNEQAHKELQKYNPDSLTKEEKISYYLLIAQYNYNNKNFKEALNNIDDYVKFASPDAVSFQMRALIYEEMNDDFSAYLNWGFCKKLQGKIDEAIVEFSNAYNIKNEDKTVLIELANLYEQNKERFVSIEYWQKVYELDKDEHAKEVLAEFYYKEGNFEKAQEYGKAVEIKEENYVGLIDKIMAFFAK